MNILILTGKFGMGHYAAANSLAEQLKNELSDAQILMEDIYHIAFPHGCESIYKTYGLLMNSPCSKLVNNAYKKAVHSEKDMPEALNLIEKQALRQLSAYLALHRPDLVIATYSLAARLLADYKTLYHSDLPVVTCITDITVHNVWTNPGTSIYLAASEETRRELMAAGVAERRIIVTGVPVSRKYQAAPKKAPRQQRELLLMGGGLGMLPTDDSFYRGLSAISGLHTTVICGKNKKLYQQLSSRYYANIDVIGYTDQVHKYMQQADLLLSKPGGITMFEAIHCQLPMLVLQPFLEQELKNAEFIAEHGLGVVLDKDPRYCLDQLEQLIKAQPLLDMMRAADRRLLRSLDEDGLVGYIRANFPAEQRCSA